MYLDEKHSNNCFTSHHFKFSMILYVISDEMDCRNIGIHHLFSEGGSNIKFRDLTLQGLPLGFDIMYLALVDRNMQVRFGLKVIWES